MRGHTGRSAKTLRLGPESTAARSALAIRTINVSAERGGMAN
jgi:hypothetical protein